MKIDHFRYLFKNAVAGFYLKPHIIMFRKPLEIWNEKTDESVKFKRLEDALEYEIDGEKVKDIILRSERLTIPELEGGRGASGGGESTFKFGHASDGRGSGGEPDKQLLPAYANTKIKAKTLDGALAEFKRNHLLADHEFAYEVDSNGYVHQYIEGQAHSVGIFAGAKVRKGERTMIVHNHPSGGAFSDSDLITMSMQTRAKGIIASGKNHDYKVEKGTHFKASAFIKAVKNARPKGKDYDDAVDKWLKANQKKYGYKYSRTKN